MIIYRIVFFITTMAIMLVLLLLGLKPMSSWLITMVIILVVYFFSGYRRSKKRILLLDEVCDPEAFYEKTVKQERITGRNPRVAVYFAINKAVALISLGRFEEAKNLLESIDQTRLSRKNNSLLIFTIDRIICYYELGDLEQAEFLFEKQISVLDPKGDRVRLSMRGLIGERYFFLKRYEECQEYISRLLEEKISKRARLGIIYRLATIDEEQGNLGEAKVKFQQVAEQGNKLWIAAESRKRIVDCNKPIE